MERLLKMKRKNTVFVDKAIDGIDGQRLEGKTNDYVASGSPRLGYMCQCLKKCSQCDCKIVSRSAFR